MSRRRRDRSSSAVAPWQMERPVVSLREPRDRRGDPSGWGTGAPRRGCTRVDFSVKRRHGERTDPRRRDAAIALPTRHHPEHCAQRLRREGVVWCRISTARLRAWTRRMPWRLFDHDEA